MHRQGELNKKAKIMKTVSDITRGYKKIMHCQRGDVKGFYKCTECNKEIQKGVKYFAIGLRASTAHEKDN